MYVVYIHGLLTYLLRHSDLGEVKESKLLLAFGQCIMEYLVQILIFRNGD